MRKKRFVSLLAGVTAAVLLATAGVATAVTTFRAGGATARQYFSTSTDAWMVPGPNTWQTVPASGVTFAIPAGTRRMITARFSAESQCEGPGWCSVRIVYTNGSAVTELAPQSGNDFAFDSAGDQWDQHTVERSSAVFLPAGTYRVSVQAMRVNSTSFRLDDYHLNVGVVVP